MTRSALILGALLLYQIPLYLGCEPHDHDHSDSGNTHAGQHAHDDHDDGHHAHDASDQPTIAVTNFSDSTELFVEFPVMSVGNASPFAAHLTWLDNFQPVAEGFVRVILRGSGLPEEEFNVGHASTPGIFRPVAIPKHAGKRELIIRLESHKAISVHNLGIQTVYENKDAIPPVLEGDGAISYLKEQQWQVDFATAPASQRTLRESIRVVATIEATSDGEAEVTAPHDGELALRGASLPTIGTRVSKGQVLAVVGSQLGRELGTSGKGISGSALRAPIEGIITHVHATVGSYLKKGQPVFHIVNPERLWLVSRIPENEVLRLINPEGAWVSLPHVDEPFRIEISGDEANGRVIAYGQTIDPRTRTVPLVLEFNNPGNRIRIGMLVEAHVFTGNTVTNVAVPVSAIVHDNGASVVYVELGGESFERRVVQLGINDGDHIEVLKGVAPGERVVSKGAYLVKLAASGPAEAGHGHAH